MVLWGKLYLSYTLLILLYLSFLFSDYILCLLGLETCLVEILSKKYDLWNNFKNPFPCFIKFWNLEVSCWCWSGWPKGLLYAKELALQYGFNAANNKLIRPRSAKYRKFGLVSWYLTQGFRSVYYLLCWNPVTIQYNTIKVYLKKKKIWP